MIKKYRKKPVVVEAVQWIGNNLEDIRVFTEDVYTYIANWDGSLSVRQLNDFMVVPPGGYVVKGTKGGFYPCKPDIFEQTYEEVPKTTLR